MIPFQSDPYIFKTIFKEFISLHKLTIVNLRKILTSILLIMAAFTSKAQFTPERLAYNFCLKCFLIM
jgi:hypothetical protein